LSLSRFEGVPPEPYINRAGSRYAVVGEAAGFATQEAGEVILAALPATESEALALETLVDTTGCDGHSPKPPSSGSRQRSDPPCQRPAKEAAPTGTAPKISFCRL